MTLELTNSKIRPFKPVLSLAETQNGLVTKHDLTEAKNEIKVDMNVRFERIDGELKLNRWMFGVLLAGVIFLVLKVFL